MQGVFVAFLLMMGFTPDYFEPDSYPQALCFWPPDMIPHPTVPGDGPKKPQPDLA
jgi:hypothetical protein